MASSPQLRLYAHWWLDRCFLYVGRIDEAKGVPQILRAWIGLADELGADCPPLWLVGGEPREIEAARIAVGIETIHAYESARRVQWWGYLDWQGISTLMLKAFVLITHSLYEPGGRVVLESMAQGIPVIATPHGFARDLIANWHSGFLVNYGDVDALKTRMSHFALQPLLRHAMGTRAQQVATKALDSWRFLDTHRQVYDSALKQNTAALSEIRALDSRLLASGPAPRGFSGAYPFESEIVDKSAVANFLQAHGGQSSATIRELSGVSGRSRIWVAQDANHSWIIKHAFSTYSTRPIWDRGYRGEPVALQRARVMGEVLGSKAMGAAPLVAADPVSGLILREWLKPSPLTSTLSEGVAVAAQFHCNPPDEIDLPAVRTQLEREWLSMNDDDVLTTLTALEGLWRAERRSWHAWSPTSLRLGWRWLELSLRRTWVSLPAMIDAEVKRYLPEEKVVAEEGEPCTSFGFCHGDLNPHHLRLLGDERNVLIDCERCHPGFFGHDWATLVLSVLDEHNDELVEPVLEQAVAELGRAVCPPRLLLSWLRLTSIMRLCRSCGLKDDAATKAALRNWQRLSRVRSLAR
jgi:hypothetical protein